MYNDYAFKIVCLDENNPLEYSVLDEVNVSDIKEVCEYISKNYKRFNLDVCKCIIIPIAKSKPIGNSK